MRKIKYIINLFRDRTINQRNFSEELENRFAWTPITTFDGQTCWFRSVMRIRVWSRKNNKDTWQWLYVKNLDHFVRYLNEKNK